MLVKDLIPLDEIKFSKLSCVDDEGRIFYWNDRLFRAINDEATAKTEEKFSSGLIDELVRNGLFPKSWISNFQLEGYSLVVEHEVLRPVTYPFEWSFSMLKDAAICVLRCNQIASSFGYQTKDCHGFNVVYDGANAKFVDMGSFIKVNASFKGWLSYGEFLTFYYYPLSMWASGNSYLARLALQGFMMPHASYLQYKFGMARLISPLALDKVAAKFVGVKQYLPCRPLKEECSFIEKCVYRLADLGLLPFCNVDFEGLARKIQAFSPPKIATQWAEYHKVLMAKRVASTPRFDRISAILEKISPSSVIELAGNAGAFSFLLKERFPELEVICSDYDENAIEHLFERLKFTGVKITPALINFMFPVTTTRCEPPPRRFESEVVLALAVTHHLLLTQGLSIQTVLETIGSYTKKYALIEFMPLGLYDGLGAPPVPKWYSIDYFRASFKETFDILHEEQLETNRVLFVGLVKPGKLSEKDIGHLGLIGSRSHTNLS